MQLDGILRDTVLSFFPICYNSAWCVLFVCIMVHMFIQVTFMGASEFDQMMDEMGEKKKTNTNDATWNHIINKRLPAITATTEHSNDDIRIRFSRFDSIGLRPYMEDRVFICGDLQREYNKTQTHATKLTVPSLKMAYFGVYDGHNGYYVAEYLQKQLHRTLFEMIANKQSQSASPASKLLPANKHHSGLFADQTNANWLQDCWLYACTAMDREVIYNDFKRQSAGLHSGTLAMEVFGGSVAAMCLLVEDMTRPSNDRLSAYMAWVGDCRAVVSDNGVCYTCVSLFA
jgi:serine/threonine protein phosphatase PrpC